MSLDPTSPPPITPDEKDWTWVLQRPCPECGFVASEVPFAEVAPRVRATGARLAELLDDDRAPHRPDPQRWSALEYACHVRDVYRLYDVRLHLMLDQDDPLFPNWDQDLTAVEDGYSVQDAADVAREIVDAAEVLAASFDAVTPEQESRPGRRSDGASFTVDSFARYFIHDPVHHIWDVEQGYAALG